MKQCPRCGLLVDERFRHCDECGFDWAEPPPSMRAALRYRWRRWGRRKFMMVLIVLLILLSPLILLLLGVLLWWVRALL